MSFDLEVTFFLTSLQSSSQAMWVGGLSQLKEVRTQFKQIIPVLVVNSKKFFSCSQSGVSVHYVNLGLFFKCR